MFFTARTGHIGGSPLKHAKMTFAFSQQRDYSLVNVVPLVE
jgi:hypothetical protein